MCSLSLLLRLVSIAGVLATRAPNKHGQLYRLSFCYRLCRFIL